MGEVQAEVGVVHGAEGVGVVGFVLLGVGLVDPLEGVHEPGGCGLVWGDRRRSAREIGLTSHRGWV